MVESLFKSYVEKFFAPLVQKVVERINGKKVEETLLYKSMLTPEYSADLKWGSKIINTSIVSADVVSTDSPLPLKRRDSFGTAQGDIPKLGMKLRKGEKDISDINVMKARGASDQTVASKIFDDIPKCIKGIEAANEIMFLQGLSTGVAMIPDAATGKGIRLNYGYLEDNIAVSGVAWGESAATPITDLNGVFSAARDAGNAIAHVMMSREAFNKLRASAEGKELSANFAGLVVTSTSKLPVPTSSRMLEALADEYSATFQVVDSSFRVEGKDGKRTPIKPFDVDNVVFLPSATGVGRLVYGDLAEKTSPVSGVVYQEGENGMLVSKYSKNDPLEEYTSSQALNIPVLDDVESIYLLKTVVPSGGDATPTS